MDSDAEVLASSGWSIDEETGDIVCDYDGSIICEKDSPFFLNVIIECTASHWGVEDQMQGESKTCKLVEIYRLKGEHSENCSDYFIDGDKKIEMGDLQGYILSQYVLRSFGRKS